MTFICANLFLLSLLIFINDPIPYLFCLGMYLMILSNRWIQIHSLLVQNIIWSTINPLSSIMSQNDGSNMSQNDGSIRSAFFRFCSQIFVVSVHCNCYVSLRRVIDSGDLLFNWLKVWLYTSDCSLIFRCGDLIYTNTGNSTVVHGKACISVSKLLFRWKWSMLTTTEYTISMRLLGCLRYKSLLAPQDREKKINKDILCSISTSGKQGQILQSKKSKSMQNPVRRALIHRRLYLEKLSEFHIEALGLFILCVSMNSSSQKFLVKHTICITEMSNTWIRVTKTCFVCHLHKPKN